MADWVNDAYQNGVVKNVSEIRYFIENKIGKIINEGLLKQVIDKMEETHERLLKQGPPYMRDREYNDLNTYKKQKKRKTK